MAGIVEHEDTGQELETLVFEDSQTPLLLRKPFVAGVVLLFIAVVGLYFVSTRFWGLSLESTPSRSGIGWKRVGRSASSCSSW